jgi:hypothetical protein
MPLKKINESPSISDEILFEITTTDSDGLVTNPYKINRVVVYFLERDALKSNNFTVFEDQVAEQGLLDKLNAAKQLALSDPTDENLLNYIKLQQEFDSNSQTKLFYYKTASVVNIAGSDNFPAWLESDLDNAILENVSDGQFTYLWQPTGAREGDYFVCWEWTPVPAGETLAKYINFSLSGDTQVTTSIPTHFTKKNKYETLLDRYTPEMFKQRLSNKDLTPEVLQEFNNAIAKGFTSLEDLVNQLLDVKDANATHESFLHLLANNYGVKLRYTDPTMWRRQIKRAIPLYKKKGTYSGLEEALDQSGVALQKFTNLWQIISPYTWQEYFIITNEEEQNFDLKYVIQEPFDIYNFELYFRYSSDADWTTMGPSDISYMTADGVTTITTVVPLSLNDEIRIVYQTKPVPNDPEQNREDYIRSLALADQRDPRDIIYPKKNWNVRVIEEDDAMFDVVIPNRHPFYENINYGKVRTEFPYSENIYNMEEYNGSIRDSKNPCDIDRDFIDNCSACRGSYYNIDVEISNLSDLRITETQEIITDNLPFHSTLHTMNFSGGMMDFVNPPVETIDCLIRFLKDDSVVIGQYTFNRAMVPDEQVTREDLAERVEVITNLSGTFYNDKIIFYSSNQELESLSFNNDDSSKNILEQLSPYTVYNLENPQNHSADTINVLDGFDPSPFTFNLSNDVLDTTADIIQDNIFTFKDSVINLLQHSIKSNWDVSYTEGYTGASWKLILSYGTFEIDSITPDGNIILINHDDYLPNSNQTGLVYTLTDDNDVVIVESDTGELYVEDRGRVDISPIDATIYPVGYYLLYDGVQYRISGHSGDYNLYIKDYSDGDVGSVNVNIYKRLATSKLGEFSYSGLTLNAGINLETALEIQNGDNPPSPVLENGRLKQNYLILIDSEYYSIKSINNNIVVLEGPPKDWTLAGTAGTFTVYRFDKKDIDIKDRTMNPKVPGYKFKSIDRDGETFIIYNNQEEVIPLLIKNNLNNNSDINETVITTENISYTIEYKDGTQEKGNV